MMKRKGFTIIEIIIVIVVLSLILLTLFKVYGQFDDVKNEVDSVTKLKTLKDNISTNLYDIKKVKEILKSVKIINTDKKTEIEDIKYYTNDKKYVPVIKERTLMPLMQYINNDSETINEALSNFLGIVFENDKMFYRNVFYFSTTTEEKFLGTILGNYKKLSFIHITDNKFASYLRRLINEYNNGENTTLNKIEEMFDLTKDYLIVKKDLNMEDNYITNDYVIENWKTIRKSINMIRFSTRNQIVEPLTFLDNQMSETQKKINDWATIQARYQAYKSISTGNTLNTDYFITCKLENEETQTCDDNIRSVNTLLKLDNGTDNGEEINLYGLPENPLEANLNYGFLIFENEENTELKASTNNCNINIDEDIDITNAVPLTKVEDTETCVTTYSIRSLVEDFNVFGYPVLFSNAKNSILNPDTLNIVIGNNRYPIDTIEAPYNATVFTVLPNNEVIVKKLYAHIF